MSAGMDLDLMMEAGEYMLNAERAGLTDEQAISLVLYQVGEDIAEAHATLARQEFCASQLYADIEQLLRGGGA
jgi:hypothetical protein